VFRKAESIRNGNKSYWVTAPTTAKDAAPDTWLAYEETQQQWVIVKGVGVFSRSDDPELTLRKRELVELATRIEGQRPNVQAILDVFEHRDDGEQQIKLGVMMPVLQGESLAALLEQGRQCSLGETLAWLEALLEALSFLYEENYIYAALHPDQIIVQQGGKRLLLVDMTIPLTGREYRKRYMQQQPPATAYLAPEQFEQRIYKQSDFFALGVVFYQMLTGVLPPSIEQRKGLKWSLVALRGDVKLPPGVQSLINHLLDLDHLKRPLDVSQIALQIDAIRAEVEQGRQRRRSRMLNKWIRQKPQQTAPPTPLQHGQRSPLNAFSELFIALAYSCLGIVMIKPLPFVLLIPPVTLIGHFFWERHRQRIIFHRPRWEFDGTLYLVALYLVPCALIYLTFLSKEPVGLSVTMIVSGFILLVVWGVALGLAGSVSEEV